MATLRDISAECGISIAAVSKALHDHSDIGEETKERVREVAKLMEYKTQKPKKRKERTYRIGVLITEEAESDFHHEIIMELRRFLTEKGFDMVMLSPCVTNGKAGAGGSPCVADGKARAEGSPEKVCAVLLQEKTAQEKPNLDKPFPERPGYASRARSLGLEGIFLFTRVLDRELYDMNSFRNLRELVIGNIPLIAVDCLFGSCSCVLPEYGKAVESLVNYVCGMGHERIALVFREEDAEGTFERAYRDALRKRNIEVPPAYLCRVRGGAEEACRAVSKLLGYARWILPTCILFTDDLLLEGGMEAIRRSGLEVPASLSVAAVMLSGGRSLTALPVTSWRFSSSEIAREAVRQMWSEISAKGSGSRRRVRLEPGALFEGETTARISEA